MENIRRHSSGLTGDDGAWACGIAQHDPGAEGECAAAVVGLVATRAGARARVAAPPVLCGISHATAHTQPTARGDTGGIAHDTVGSGVTEVERTATYVDRATYASGISRLIACEGGTIDVESGGACIAAKQQSTTGAPCGSCRVPRER